jgi:hypothetical protein
VVAVLIEDLLSIQRLFVLKEPAYYPVRLMGTADATEENWERYSNGMPRGLVSAWPS